jgi:hypothetical protein
MNKNFFTLYQYIGPIILTPLSFWLWWHSYQGDIKRTLIAWLIPILYSYIVPAIGTNVLKVWEFNTRYKLGNFRPHHGFVFGSATAMIAWLIHPIVASTLFLVFQTGIIFASTLGLINIVYDIKAIKDGILIVYNQPYADKKTEEAIVMDYALWFFGVFGLIYGVGVGFSEWLTYHYYLNTFTFTLLFFGILVLSILIPVWGYRKSSLKKYGHDGCRPIK